MIVAEARVLRCDADCLWVDVQRPGGCANCAGQSGCSTAVLAPFFSRRQAPLRVARRGAQARLPGETVRIGIRESTLLRGSLWLYLWPVVGLIIGAVLGQALGERVFSQANETLTVIGGLSGLSGAFWLIAKRSARASAGPEVVLLDEPRRSRSPRR